MEMNPAAKVLENDDPRVVVVVMHASTSTSKGDLYSS